MLQHRAALYLVATSLMRASSWTLCIRSSLTQRFSSLYISLKFFQRQEVSLSSTNIMASVLQVSQKDVSFVNDYGVAQRPLSLPNFSFNSVRMTSLAYLFAWRCSTNESLCFKPSWLRNFSKPTLTNCQPLSLSMQWSPMPTNDVLPAKLLNLLGRDGDQWFCIYPFSKIIYEYDEKLDLPLCQW